MKYQPSIQLLDLASDLLTQAAPLLFTENTWDVIIPVPSSPSHLRKRLLHPCAELARGIAHSLKVPRRNLLIHGSNRAPQATLSHDNRLRRLTQLFYVKDMSTVRNQRVLLVEDVITTGATINAAAFKLLEAGAENVDVLALARTRVWRKFRSRLYGLFEEKMSRGLAAAASEIMPTCSPSPSTL